MNHRKNRKMWILGVVVWLLAASTWQEASAQHTVGVYGGYGMGTSRIYPKYETRGTWGLYTAGLSWRHYGKQRFAGGFGIDVEWLESAYSFATNTHIVDNEDEYTWYTRRVNTVSVPIVWQPHFYIKQRARIFLEAAATFSYRFKSTYQSPSVPGMPVTEYTFKTARDNRFGYGLAFGGGASLLIKQFEIQLKARYYFGLGDVLKNRNKYADSVTDGPENPFWMQPLRTPLDNIMFTIGVSYRFNKEGFDVWFIKREKLQKSGVEFGYKTDGSKSSNNNRRAGSGARPQMPRGR